MTRSTTRRDAITPYAAGEEEVVEIMLAPFRRAAPGGEDADCAPRNTRGWRKFAELINTAWRKGAGAFLEVGRHLIQAKPLFPLENPGILSIPIGFLAAVIATLLTHEPTSETKFNELLVRSNTGLGAEKATATH